MGIAQKNPHQATTYDPLSSNNHFLHSSSIPTAYDFCSNTNSYNTSQDRAFSRVYNREPIIPTFTTLISSNSSGFMSPFDGTYNQLNQDSKNNSCSSSDGSQITKEMEPDYRLFHGDYQSTYFTNGVNENNQKFLLSGYSSSSSEAAVANGCLSGNPLDYSIEEIKQLMSCNNLNFFVDEIKTEDKLLDY
ncbi:hypothetical protein CDL12_15869 [Handroanthus impetiginosus]|nr:hypothetical protein CDL12_15869 [Handroanthus impetiginosus]